MADETKASTTEDVRAMITRLRRDLDGKTVGACSPADVALSGALAYAERDALPIAEERDRLATELAEVKAVLVEWHRAGVAVDRWDPSGPERARAVYDTLDALAAKYASEAKR